MCNQTQYSYQTQLREVVFCSHTCVHMVGCVHLCSSVSILTALEQGPFKNELRTTQLLEIKLYILYNDNVNIHDNDYFYVTIISNQKRSKSFATRENISVLTVCFVSSYSVVLFSYLLIKQKDFQKWAACRALISLAFTQIRNVLLTTENFSSQMR